MNLKYSFVMDLVNGMLYLHNSPIKSHGRLRSDNCLLNSKFIIKITDFGLDSLQNFFHSNQKEMTKLWHPPEFLRNVHPINGTQMGDVYSFGIVLQEIILRTLPYNKNFVDFNLSKIDLVNMIKNIKSPRKGKLYRPRIPQDSCSKEMKEIMEKCWVEDPNLRPTFKEISIEFNNLLNLENINVNYVKNMVERLTLYNKNLEKVIKEKTEKIVGEQEKVENLLSAMLPKAIIESLKIGQSYICQSYESVTIYFSEIHKFSEISSINSPEYIVKLLNDIYSFLDEISSHFDVYKVETIRDSYMVASGVPVKNGNDHSNEIALMSLQIINSIKNKKIDYLRNCDLQFKIGIHSGPCAAGVIGTAIPRYCLFGDTINIASRMESFGLPMKIQISEFTKCLLDTYHGYEYEERGFINIKGKGMIRTYWLLGKKDLKPLC
ncbi:atrial natriuretic peptide receptor 1-like [Gordionus sp. m RMFG-2023]|uniref:atrial natriuretic peptide receptor 1-like n=1 Tax=Gordionus sp. m RMFG-2023 TaxID=3053472 RepID=UPI0031FBC3A9